jgi:hypothetical protein
MIIDCDRCNVRGLACANCAITFITVEQAAPAPHEPRAGQPPQATLASLAAPQLPQFAPQPPQAGPHAAEAPRPADAPTATQARQGRRTGPRTGQAAEVELDAADVRALAVLASAGLIPPLRYAPAMAKASLGYANPAPGRHAAEDP